MGSDHYWPMTKIINGVLTASITVAAKVLNSSELGSERADVNVRLRLKKRPRDPSVSKGGTGNVTVAVVVPSDEVVLATGDMEMGAEWK